MVWHTPRAMSQYGRARRSRNCVAETVVSWWPVKVMARVAVMVECSAIMVRRSDGEANGVGGSGGDVEWSVSA